MMSLDSLSVKINDDDDNHNNNDDDKKNSPHVATQGLQHVLKKCRTNSSTIFPDICPSTVEGPG